MNYSESIDELLAVISLADSIRKESKEVVSILKKKKIESAIVTGDGQKTADLIAVKLGIDKVYAEQPPQVKGSIVNQIQKEGKAVVSHNAIKHGLYAKDIVINTQLLKEDQSEYD